MLTLAAYSLVSLLFLAEINPYSFFRFKIFVILVSLLNQAHAWFLEIAFVRDVGVCVCVRVRVCPPPRL